MARKTIDGRCFASMLRGGAAMLLEHSSEINDLNVFPVPDGDTGTNMAKTMDGGLSSISDDESIGKVCDGFTHGALLGARGNSGVILSQIFAGIDEELSRYDEVGATELVEAYKRGIAKSYAAVQHPTEGTILTVFRESVEYAEKNITDSSSIEDFFRLHIESAKESLARTKEILPALAEADVVDSGGAGYLYIIVGMYKVLTGEISDSIYKAPPVADTASVDLDLFTRDSVLEFGYCTEFMLRLMSAKCDPDSFDTARIISELEALGGESIVAYKTDDIIKVHVHTFAPGAVLSMAQKYGEFLTLKIENMSLGHSESKKNNKPKKPFSVIAVASGEGLTALFSELGADEIISGGQTLNPSTNDFIAAFDRVNSENIIVLPNNKNVILTAKQAAELYGKSKIHIVPTKNLMQGYGALSVLTAGIGDVDALVESLKRAADGVVGSEITKAVRDVTVNGQNINRGDYIAITGSEITAVADTAEEAVLQMLAGLDMDDYEIITLFVGKNVSNEDRVALTSQIEDEYCACELEVFESGNDIYDYMIAVE